MKAKGIAKDLGAGVVHGLVSVPDGLATGLLAGLNPVTGLYGYLIGTVAGAASTSSVLMSVQGTGAMAALIADVPQLHGGGNTAGLLAMLGILTGVFMLTLGLLRWGSLLRFVPNAVLIGFVNAVAINIVLGQFASFTGFSSEAPNRLFRAVDTLIHAALFNWPTVVVGLITLALMLLLERTPLGPLSLVVAVIAGSALAALPVFGSVQLLSDVASISAGLPTVVMPSLTATTELIIPALSLTFVGLVQGAAISQSVVNPNGSYPDVSGDFRGQGLANIASGFLGGMPVGGSMSGTAVVRAAGARSRLANFTAGAVMAIIILALSDLVGRVAMPALAALLILVGARMFKIGQLRMVWRTGPAQAMILITTFVLTLVIPLQYAVLVGVAVSIAMFVSNQSNNLKLVRRVSVAGSTLDREEKPPAKLPAHEVVVLGIYGSLFFASTLRFAEQLPTVTPTSRGSAVVIRLRRKEDLGSAIIQTIIRYQAELGAVDSYLILTGVSDRLYTQLTATKTLEKIGTHNVYLATEHPGESLARGITRAELLVALHRVENQKPDNDPMGTE